MALLVGAWLTLPSAAAARAPSLYAVNITGPPSTVSQYSIAASGKLAPLNPPTVESGTTSTQLALSPDGRSAYVTNLDAASTSVSQYDVAPGGRLTPKDPPTVATDFCPTGIAVTPDGENAYVADNCAGDPTSKISQYDIDPADGSLLPMDPPTVPTDIGPFRVAITPDGGSLYVTNANGMVSQYSIGPDGSLAPKDPPTVSGAGNLGIAVHPDGASAYVTDFGDGLVHQYDVDPDDGTLSPKATPSAPAGTNPGGIALHPNGESAYVADLASDNVRQYDVAPDGSLSPSTPPTVEAGSDPREIAVSADTRSAYVTNQEADTVSQYDIAGNGTLIPKSPPTVDTGFEPIGIAVRPDAIGPLTTIGSGPSGTVASRDATFTFSADEAGSSFRCSLGGAPFSACSSPQGYDGLADGGHSFRVRATDFTGNTGPVAARSWTVDTSGPPSNEFSLALASRNRKKGTAKLAVAVPGAGDVTLTGRRALERTSSPSGAAIVKLSVRAKGKARRKLNRRGKAKVSVDVTFTPTGGEPNIQSKALKLIQHRR